MVKGMYQHIRSVCRGQKIKDLIRDRMIEWRKEPRFKKIEKPTRLDRARGLGYKSKGGFVLVRARIGRGGRKRPLYGKRGRKPSKAGLVRYTPRKSLRKIAEQRVQKKYPNLNVLNSYWAAEDGRYVWFEVILVDLNSPEIKKDKNMKWITEKQHRKRVLRH